MRRTGTARFALAALFMVALAAHPTLAAAQATEPAAPAAEPAAPAAEPATPAAAQPVAGAEPASPPVGRTLNGHRFMPTAVVSQPFTTTSLASYLVVAAGNTTGTLQVGDQVYSGTFDYAGVGGVLAYEYAFFHYFSARFTLTEIIYSGITGKSALVIGTTAQVGASLGLTASMPLGDSLRLAFLVDAGSTPNLSLTIGTGIADIVNRCKASGGQGCTVNTGELFGSTNVATVQPAVSVSWAPFSSLGITGNAGYVRATQTKTGSTFDGQAMFLGGAADFDFRAISSVPIGLMAQINWTAPFSGTGLQHVTDVGGGIFYTGRKDLAAGIQVIGRRFAVTPDVNVSFSTYVTTLGLRYYWQ
ncbi:hypothetical protein [Anaeromyxobacter oryzae]|uniref:Uncharacterized protein n=1 Tax=Anaeromyxobacter oryzae TaxID=2918170 RepID=A0ABM7X1I1_9BACT|nr:hypothetical protein [Anaeromyxobacter oryzae]BDG05635.1 hypothetical protein AMOR_46310 [Anaeromyxobacter oryzae]